MKAMMISKTLLAVTIMAVTAGAAHAAEQGDQAQVMQSVIGEVMNAKADNNNFGRAKSVVMNRLGWNADQAGDFVNAAWSGKTLPMTDLTPAKPGDTSTVTVKNSTKEAKLSYRGDQARIVDHTPPTAVEKGATFAKGQPDPELGESKVISHVNKGSNRDRKDSGVSPARYGVTDSNKEAKMFYHDVLAPVVDHTPPTAVEKGATFTKGQPDPELGESKVISHVNKGSNRDRKDSGVSPARYGVTDSTKEAKMFYHDVLAPVVDHTPPTAVEKGATFTKGQPDPELGESKVISHVNKGSNRDRKDSGVSPAQYGVTDSTKEAKLSYRNDQTRIVDHTPPTAVEKGATFTKGQPDPELGESKVISHVNKGINRDRKDSGVTPATGVKEPTGAELIKSNQERTAPQATALAAAQGKALVAANLERTAPQATALAAAQGKALVAANLERTAPQATAEAKAHGEALTAANRERTAKQVVTLAAQQPQPQVTGEYANAQAVAANSKAIRNEAASRRSADAASLRAAQSYTDNAIAGVNNHLNSQDKKIHENAERTKRTEAMAQALTSLHYNGNVSGYAVGAGTMEGKEAIAGGMQYGIDEHHAVTVQASYDGENAGGGVGFHGDF